jgi:hypothetical protein
MHEVIPGSQGSGTRFIRENGKIFLEYFGATGSGSNLVQRSDRRQLPDGTWELKVTITTPPPGHGSTNDMKYFTYRWDVTQAIKKGLVFTQKVVQPGSAELNIPEKVTIQSNPLLIPPSRL